MYKIIQSITEVKLGYPGLPHSDGQIPFIQLRQFNEDGVYLPAEVDHLKLNENMRTHFLEEGDVLFTGKGNRLFAWCYMHDGEPTIASSSFFVLRPDRRLIQPEYLTAILNAPQTKASLAQLGAGTNIFSIRKSELASFQIPVLPMAQQTRIAALSKLHQQEVSLSKELISQKQNFYSAIISKLIK
jgi:restriction endonuclease S subunit